MKTRKPAMVRLTPEALEYWHKFAEANGCTLTAAVEAMAHHLPQGPLAHGWFLQLDNVITRARRLSSERRDQRKKEAA